MTARRDIPYSLGTLHLCRNLVILTREGMLRGGESGGECL